MSLDEDTTRALLLSHPSYREPLALFCTGDEPRRKRAELCERPKDVDALAVGVVTTWDLATVPAVKPQASRQIHRRLGKLPDSI